MAERKNSEKRIATNNRWTNAHYDRINIAVPKGRKDEIKALADTRGQSVNAYIISALDEKVERDNARLASSGRQEVAGASTEAWVALLPDALESAKRAAERAGEAPAVFIARANTQEQRDKPSFRLGIDPATGENLKGEA